MASDYKFVFADNLYQGNVCAEGERLAPIDLLARVRDRHAKEQHTLAQWVKEECWHVILPFQVLLLSRVPNAHVHCKPFRGEEVALQKCWHNSRFPLCFEDAQKHLACIKEKRLLTAALAANWEAEQMRVCGRQGRQAQ